MIQRIHQRETFRNQLRMSEFAGLNSEQRLVRYRGLYKEQAFMVKVFRSLPSSVENFFR